ncbi:hypothetical protein [Bacillus benzoevorans]|uniref:Uncharacterized protein n=1 Tax=Bacillus benzoevorans TaxID=1456 RepID=A0A7X0HVG1_9BACI|nr:hypothetical protein [Bacillus benzoevorans]MBB6447594.1 hypothetical protein [Bacillus benzoevorans]
MTIYKNPIPHDRVFAIPSFKKTTGSMPHLSIKIKLNHKHQLTSPNHANNQSHLEKSGNVSRMIGSIP